MQKLPREDTTSYSLVLNFDIKFVSFFKNLTSKIIIKIKYILLEIVIAIAILFKQFFKFSTKFLLVLVKTLFKTSVSASAYIFLTILLVCGIIKPRTYTLIVLIVHSFDLACRVKGFFQDVPS